MSQPSAIVPQAPGGFNNPAGGGGRPSRKPGNTAPGRAHEAEKPVVPMSRRAKENARKHEDIAKKGSNVAASNSQVDIDNENSEDNPIFIKDESPEVTG